MRFGISLVALSLLTASLPAAPPAAKPKPVDVVLCLDTSNSMDGLIDSAKRKLWAIVNDLAKIEPTPTLRVALYSYGNDSYDPKTGWVRKDLDLTSDLDEVYKKLFALTTKRRHRVRRPRQPRRPRRPQVDRRQGRPEDHVRLRQRAGRPGQGGHAATRSPTRPRPRASSSTPSTAIRPASPEAAGWQEFAELAGGKYANIDQDHARTPVVIKTPFDDEIQEARRARSTTRTAGTARRASRPRPEPDRPRTRTPRRRLGDAATERGVTKASKLYCNADCDLIDRMETDEGLRPDEDQGRGPAGGAEEAQAGGAAGRT